MPANEYTRKFLTGFSRDSSGSPHDTVNPHKHNNKEVTNGDRESYFPKNITAQSGGRKTGLARSTIYKRIAEDKFPKQINLGGARAVGWLESDIDDWINQQQMND